LLQKSTRPGQFCWVDMHRAANQAIVISQYNFNSAWSILRRIEFFLVILVILVSGCATTDDPYHGLDNKSRIYRVKKGDTLYGISRRVGREFNLIAKWNGISAPYRIREGQTIRLFPPPESPQEKTVTRRPVQSQSVPRRPPQRQTAQRQTPKRPIAQGQSVRRSNSAVSAPIVKESGPTEKNSKKKLKDSWIWPLKGVIAKNYSQTGRKGLDIAGKFGEPVRAAADGKIVYCGQGLIGYGNLVIVKHDAHFLSAYGNNSRLLVREGDTIKKGQRIAEVGLDANKQPLLHFEIRKDGKPVNPIQHLPKP
jgi:lipoprotein NlpD